MRNPAFICRLVWVLGLFWALDSHSASTPLQATAVVEDSTVFIGQPFLYQIQVRSSSTPETPDLSGLADFDAHFRGTQSQTSQSISIINGQVTRVENNTYYLTFQLIPKKEGRFVIPAVTIKADGASVQTQPLAIQVTKPVELPNFKLRLELTRTNCFVGEPVLLEVTWYVAQQVRSPQFVLPLLDNDAFHIIDPPRPNSPANRLMEVPVNEGKAVAEQGQGSLEGRSFTTLRFQKVLIPKREGLTTVDSATVAFETFTATPRGNLPRKAVIPSNTLHLQVKPLPEEGRPVHFAGHIGRYDIASSAQPTEVNLGDPITLTVRISGPPYLEHITLPPLIHQPAFSNNFKISTDADPARLEDSAKVFSQTIRALRVDLKEIPPVELPYFDTEKERYQIARSEPIPLTVRLAKVVTAGDAEGLTPTLSGSVVETSAQGIAHNYEDLDALKDQRFGPSVWLRSPLWLGLVVFPPSAYLILAIAMWVLHRQYANPRAVRARRALAHLTKSLGSLPPEDSPQTPEAVLAALKTYLADKLGLAAGAVTFRDVKEPLRQKGVSEETIQLLQDLFRTCEASRYAGPADPGKARPLIQQCQEVAAQIELALK